MCLPIGSSVNLIDLLTLFTHLNDLIERMNAAP